MSWWHRDIEETTIPYLVIIACRSTYLCRTVILIHNNIVFQNSCLIKWIAQKEFWQKWGLSLGYPPDHFPTAVLVESIKIIQLNQIKSKQIKTNAITENFKWYESLYHFSQAKTVHLVKFSCDAVISSSFSCKLKSQKKVTVKSMETVLSLNNKERKRKRLESHRNMSRG